MNRDKQPSPKRIARELLCLGRLAVDLYGEQIDSPLEDVSSFAKYLGGSSANVAVGSARLGLDVGMLSRVGDEQMGRFLLAELAREKVSTAAVTLDPTRLTGLAILSIADAATFPLLFYRQDCADMALCADDVKREYFHDLKALAISGTHLSRDGVRGAALRALSHAREAGAKTVLDIDYRPVLWGLTPLSAGEVRYVGSEGVSATLKPMLKHFDLIVGTEEEFMIAGGSADLLEAVQSVRAASPATLVVKRGAQGCVVIEDAVPARLEDGLVCPAFPVQVFNVLGAGDAFLAGFLRGWLRGESLAVCGRIANAAGALVVARHGCAPAMPSWEEVQEFMSRAQPPRQPWTDARLEHLHWVAGRRPHVGDVCALAFDHRRQMVDLAAELGLDDARVGDFKSLMGRALTEVAQKRPGLQPAILADHTYASAVLALSQRKGWWIARPTEVSGSRPLAFEAGQHLERAMRSWPRGQIAKTLVFFNADDEEDMRVTQLDALKNLFDVCRATGHEMLVEVIPSRGNYATQVPAAVRQMYAAGVLPDWWKIPDLQTPAGWAEMDRAVQDCDPHCRGALLLGLEAPMPALSKAFAAAARSRVCRGFAVGRTIFAEPARLWLSGQVNDEETVQRIGSNFEAVLEAWLAVREQVTQDRTIPAPLIDI